MGKNRGSQPSRRKLLATAEATLTPPTTLPAEHVVARVTEIRGNNLYNVLVPPSSLARKIKPIMGVDTSEKAIQSQNQIETTVSGSETETLLVELPSRFRNTIWLKRGSYVLVNCGAFTGRDNKLDGLIENIVRDLKSWRKQPWWPPEFAVQSASMTDISDDDSEDNSAINDRHSSEAEDK